MPIHHDTIEDGQNKKSHLLFILYSQLELCYFSILTAGFIVKNSPTNISLASLNNYTPHDENKHFKPKTQNHRVAFVTPVNSACLHTRNAICKFTQVTYATSLRNC